MPKISKKSEAEIDNFHLIPTGFRYSISKELSFPVGAELISKALFGVPDYDKLRLDFSAYGDRARPHSVREMVEAGEQLAIVNVWGNTNIRVEPVLREHKSVVRKVLSDIGLPRLRQWLIDYKKWSDEEADVFRWRRRTLFVGIAEETFRFSEETVRGPNPRR